MKGDQIDLTPPPYPNPLLLPEKNYPQKNPARQGSR